MQFNGMAALALQGAHMRQLRIGLMSVMTAALLAACGGGDVTVPGSGEPAGAPTAKGNFSSVVSFGDSLVDLGAYSPATSFAGNGLPPYLGGKFSTNFSTGTVWVENIAAALGLMITPAEMGFAGQSEKCPVEKVHPALAGTCTGYGQAGSRVTNPDGYNHAKGFLTVPMTTQVANHLARFGSFKDTDLVLVSIGFNEVFVQFEQYFVPALMALQAQLQAGQISEDQFKAAVFSAQTDAQQEMKNAALELADLVRKQILAKGAKYVAVTSLIDMSKTPEAMALPASIRPLLNVLPQTFELWLRDGLTGQPVKFIDVRSVFDDMTSNPATYGFVNTTGRACDAARMPAASGGSSLFCNTTPGAPYNALAAGADVNTWLFADGVHPTTGGHKAFSDAIVKQLQGFGWI
jgi:phospholipase/lecithinase/hemolysin